MPWKTSPSENSHLVWFQTIIFLTIQWIILDTSQLNGALEVKPFITYFYPEHKPSTTIIAFLNNTRSSFEEKLACALSKMKEVLDKSAPFAEHFNHDLDETLM